MTVDEAIEGLRRYAFTSWEDGGPGHSTLTAKIKVVLAEIERLREVLQSIAEGEPPGRAQTWPGFARRLQREAAEAAAKEDPFLTVARLQAEHKEKKEAAQAAEGGG